MKLNIKKKLKSLTALALATATFLSTPLQSFAAGGLEGNAGGSSGTGIVTSTGGDFGVNVDVTNPENSMGRIGIRLSLVNADDPTQVISKNNNGEETVLDILYTSDTQFYNFTNQTNGYFTPVDWAETGFSSVKTQPLMAKNTAGAPNIQWFYFDGSLHTGAKDEAGNEIMFDIKNIPPWIVYEGNSYNARGEEFVRWCKSDDAGRQIIGEDGQILTMSYTINVFGLWQRIDRVVNTATGELETSITGAFGTTTRTHDPADYGSLTDYVYSVLERVKEWPDKVSGGYAWFQHNTDESTELLNDFAETKSNIDALEQAGFASADAMRQQYNEAVAAMEQKYEGFGGLLDPLVTGIAKDNLEKTGGSWNPLEGGNAINEMLEYNPGQSATSSATSTGQGIEGVSYIQQNLLNRLSAHHFSKQVLLFQQENLLDKYMFS